MKLNLQYVSHPGKTYFFQRLDGTIFPCDYRQAFQLSNHHGKFKQIGVSNGDTFFKLVTDLHKDVRSRLDELDKKLKYEEITLRNYDEQVDDLRKELATGTIKAQEAELEVARGHLENINVSGGVNLTDKSGVMLPSADTSKIQNLIRI